MPSYYALLLRPGCYGHVYVFRILGVINIIQLADPAKFVPPQNQ
jgi:hypothetical protein